jgi:hypothetical protein
VNPNALNGWDTSLLPADPCGGNPNCVTVFADSDLVPTFSPCSLWGILCGTSSPPNTAANNGTKVSCAGKTVLLPGNYRVQSNANGMITAVGIPLTGSYPYTSGPVTIAPNTIVGVGLEQNGALSVSVNNPIYYSAGFFGAYISSATYNSGAFTQVNGTRAVLGLPLSSSQTSSGYLLNQFNQNSSLANTASLLQSVAQVGQMLVGCSAVTGGS